jgi:hypothetical protein
MLHWLSFNHRFHFTHARVSESRRAVSRAGDALLVLSSVCPLTECMHVKVPPIDAALERDLFVCAGAWCELAPDTIALGQFLEAVSQLKCNEVSLCDPSTTTRLIPQP